MTLKLDNSIPKDPYTKQLCVLINKMREHTNDCDVNQEEWVRT